MSTSARWRYCCLQVQTVTELCQDCSFFGLFPMAVRIPWTPMMSYAEKPDDITKEEWMEKLNNVHIQRADMNRLIMNYLVTGETCHAWMMAVTYLLSCTPPKCLLGFSLCQRDSKRLQRSFVWSPGSSQVWTWTLWTRG